MGDAHTLKRIWLVCRFYGRLKGLRGAALESAIEASLRSVNLLSGGWGMTRQAMQYSGTARSSVRLCYACPLLGATFLLQTDWQKSYLQCCHLLRGTSLKATRPSATSSMCAAVSKRSKLLVVQTLPSTPINPM